MNEVLRVINKSFGTYNVKGLYIEPTYWQAAAIVILLFLLVFTMARLRFLYLHWHLDKNTISFFFWGFFLALILEGFLIVSGRTFLTEILGWKNPPKPIARTLELGREKLVNVLGVDEEIPNANANEKRTYESVIGEYENLQDKEKEMVKKYFCEP